MFIIYEKEINVLALQNQQLNQLKEHFEQLINLFAEENQQLHVLSTDLKAVLAGEQSVVKETLAVEENLRKEGESLHTHVVAQRTQLDHTEQTVQQTRTLLASLMHQVTSVIGALRNVKNEKDGLALELKTMATIQDQLKNGFTSCLTRAAETIH